jgi:hypothetical protein
LRQDHAHEHDTRTVVRRSLGRTDDDGGRTVSGLLQLPRAGLPVFARGRRREAQERERQQQERERQQAEAQEHSREQLLEIVEKWSLARSIEAFFDDALRRSKDLDAEHLAAIKDRLAKARAMLGALDALARFRQWKTPEELLAPEQSA